MSGAHKSHRQVFRKNIVISDNGIFRNKQTRFSMCVKSILSVQFRGRIRNHLPILLIKIATIIFKRWRSLQQNSVSRLSALNIFEFVCIYSWSFDSLSIFPFSTIRHFLVRTWKVLPARKFRVECDIFFCSLLLFKISSHSCAFLCYFGSILLTRRSLGGVDFPTITSTARTSLPWTFRIQIFFDNNCISSKEYIQNRVAVTQKLSPISLALQLAVKEISIAVSSWR